MSKKAGLTLILFIGILQFLTAQHTEIVQGREFIVHHVKHGETLYGIAKKYEVPQDTILAYNNAAQSGIKVEQVLKFPSKNALSNNNTATYIKHVVQYGETLYGIAKKYGVSVEEIEKINPQIKNGLKAEDVILIPSRSTNKQEEHKENTNNDKDNKDKNKDQKNPNNAFAGDEPLNCDTFTVQKKTYKVALILPFKGNNFASSKIATEFYYGFKVAVDSVASKMKVGVKLFVMNSSAASDSDKTEEKYDFNKLKDMDLIIGPLYSANIKPVAQFAKENHIPIVSPFTKSTSLIEGNPFAIKITPSDKTLAARTLDYFNTTYPGCNFVLVNASKGGRDSVLHAAYSEALDSMGITDTNRIHKVRSNPSAYFKSGSRNVVIYINSREVNVKAFITGFNQSYKKNNVSLVGTENWLEFNNVEADYYMNLNLHIPVATYADFTDSTKYDYFIRKYQYAVKADPTDYSFKGYKIGSDFMRRFFTYDGHICDCVDKYKETDEKQKLPFNFNFVRKTEQDGWENNAIQILRVQEKYYLEIVNY
jgi:LysM repeat protein